MSPMVDTDLHEAISRYPCKKDEGNDTDTTATEETNDSFFGSMGGETWDLSWYECFRAFESKQIERKTLSSDIIDENCRKIMYRIDEHEEFSTDGNNGVLVPPAVLVQLEAVKQQMTEYNTMLEVYEETLEKNLKLQKEIHLMKNAHEDLRVQYESRMKRQADRMKRINTKYSNVDSELEKMRKRLHASQKNEDIRKRSLAKCMVELKLQRQLNYYEEQDAAKSSKDETDCVDKALRNQSSLSDSILPSSKSTTNDKQIWRAICKAASAIDNNDDNRSIGDDSSVNRQVKKNMLKMIIKNLQPEGNFDLNSDNNSKSSKGSSSLVGTPVTTIKPRRKLQRQNSGCSDISTDDWDAISELTNPDLRPWKQSSIKKFFTSCLTTLQDEGEEKEDDDGSTEINFLQRKL